MKRLCDLGLSIFGLMLLSPILLFFMFAVWLQDGFNPFYFALRAGKNKKPFYMVKLRSMIKSADNSGVTSTSNNDNRITKIGKVIRKYKIDEIPQLWNVLKGHMSLVGPRPQVISHIDENYTTEEMKILLLRPGITDFSSIVFSDEGDILKNSLDPDLDYNLLIRPWKSRLCILYVENHNIILDIKLIYLTIISIFSKQRSLKGINLILLNLKADNKLIKICQRHEILLPSTPPGL